MTEIASVPSLTWSLEYLNAINAEILSVLGNDSSDMDKLIREAVSEGRRTRAIIAMLWCEALSGDYTEAVPIATAYELAHSAALVEDDVIDRSSSKLGRETIPNKYGTSAAVLLSNTLLFYAPTLIARYSRNGRDPEITASLLELLGECGRLSAEGEWMDLEMAKMPEVSESQYEEMITKKTGALVGAASASGALVGNGKMEPALIDTAYSFGESLGMAYQIQDDLRDYLGSEAAMGKAAFGDLKNRKRSLPIIHCLRMADKDEKRFLNSLLEGREPVTGSSEDQVKKLLLNYGSDEYCRQTALKSVNKAAASLSAIKNESRAKERLFELIDYLAIRD